MTSKVVSRKELRLKGDPKLLSPPILHEPIYQCAIAVTVRGYVTDAKIDVQVNGATVATVSGGSPWPNGVYGPWLRFISFKCRFVMRAWCFLMNATASPFAAV